MKIIEKVVIFWFRRDLRFDDNAGLYEALQSGFKMIPLFIFDTNILSQLEDKTDKRVDLIHQVLEIMKNELELAGSSLIVRTGDPLDIFKQLTSEFKIASVFCNRDYEQYAIHRDSEIAAFLKTIHIDFKSYKDQVIFEANEVLKSNGEPYTIFTPYSKVWKYRLTEKDYLPFKSEVAINNFVKIEKQHLPDVIELGFNKTNFIYSKPFPEILIIQSYDTTRNFPAINGTTGLSTHLRFGTISIRKLVKLAVQLNESWLNELIWRDFFMSILSHFTYIEKSAFKKKYDLIEWRNNELEFQKWCEGKTGYPIVDAGMRELNQTGLMHNRVRMIVASFLTKHLLIDWRWGEAYFASKLLDYELASNNGNWQWSAGCGCDAAPYFRIFNPTEQTKRYDPELKYIRKWVKELDSFEYPQPIVEHNFARTRALEVYKRSLNETI